jgi:ribosome-associated heat shock protein Hsp15
MLGGMESGGGMRLDKWLWCVRVYKTRREAIDACRSGRVSVNSVTAKPARTIHPGDLIEARTQTFDRRLKVSALTDRRLSAKLAVDYCEDLTPKAEYERGRKTAVERILGRPRGSGRPTKRERREIDRLLD